MTTIYFYHKDDGSVRMYSKSQIEYDPNFLIETILEISNEDYQRIKDNNPYKIINNNIIFE